MYRHWGFVQAVRPIGRVEEIALLFLDHGTRRGWGVSVMPRPLITPGKDLVPIVQEAGWAPGPVWTGAENLAPPGFDTRTVQPVASRYIDYATRPTRFCHSTDLFRGWRILWKRYSEFSLDSHHRFLLSIVPAHRTFFFSWVAVLTSVLYSCGKGEITS